MRSMGGDSYLQRRGIEGLYATNVLNYYSGYWILSHLIIRNNIFLSFFNFLIPQVLSKKLEAQQEKLRELDSREVELHARIGECFKLRYFNSTFISVRIQCTHIELKWFKLT